MSDKRETNKKKKKKPKEEREEIACESWVKNSRFH